MKLNLSKDICKKCFIDGVEDFPSFKESWEAFLGGDNFDFLVENREIKCSSCQVVKGSDYCYDCFYSRFVMVFEREWFWSNKEGRVCIKFFSEKAWERSCPYKMEHIINEKTI